MGHAEHLHAKAERCPRCLRPKRKSRRSDQGLPVGCRLTGSFGCDIARQGALAATDVLKEQATVAPCLTAGANCDAEIHWGPAERLLAGEEAVHG